MSTIVDDVRAAVRVTLTPPPGAQTAAVGMQEALVATATLLLALWVGKHLAAITGAGSVIFTLIAAFQLYAPLHLIQRAGEAPESHGIHVHGVLLGPVAALRGLVVRGLRRRRRRRPRWALPLTRLLAHYGRGASLRGAAFLEDIGRAVVVAIVTFAPFALGHHLWQTLVFHHQFGAFQAPDDLHITLLKQVFLIALPEELFYRGFLETRLERVWPTRRTILGIPLGRAVVVASALFALGHFVGEYNPARLGPFFPAFIFSMLVRRSRSITGAILYHGLANSFSYFLAYCYH
jgi:membrane protease YdiL (CAAX protease family)